MGSITYRVMNASLISLESAHTPPYPVSLRIGSTLGVVTSLIESVVYGIFSLIARIFATLFSRSPWMSHLHTKIYNLLLDSNHILTVCFKIAWNRPISSPLVNSSHTTPLQHQPSIPSTMPQQQLLPITPSNITEQQLLPITPSTMPQQQLLPITPSNITGNQLLPITSSSVLEQQQSSIDNSNSQNTGQRTSSIELLSDEQVLACIPNIPPNVAVVQPATLLDQFFNQYNNTVQSKHLVHILQLNRLKGAIFTDILRKVHGPGILSNTTQLNARQRILDTRFEEKVKKMSLSLNFDEDYVAAIQDPLMQSMVLPCLFREADVGAKIAGILQILPGEHRSQLKTTVINYLVSKISAMQNIGDFIGLINTIGKMRELFETVHEELSIRELSDKLSDFVSNPEENNEVNSDSLSRILSGDAPLLSAEQLGQLYREMTDLGLSERIQNQIGIPIINKVVEELARAGFTSENYTTQIAAFNQSVPVPVYYCIVVKSVVLAFTNLKNKIQTERRLDIEALTNHLKRCKDLISKDIIDSTFLITEKQALEAICDQLIEQAQSFAEDSTVTYEVAKLLLLQNAFGALSEILSLGSEFTIEMDTINDDVLAQQTQQELDEEIINNDNIITHNFEENAVDNLLTDEQVAEQLQNQENNNY